MKFHKHKGGGKADDGEDLSASDGGRRRRVADKVKRAVSVVNAFADGHNMQISERSGRSSGRSSYATANDDSPGDDIEFEGGGINGGDITGGTKDSAWDICACIDVIESLRDLDGLSPKQQAAITNLRAASRRRAMADGNNLDVGDSCRSLGRRDAIFYGLERGLSKAALLIRDKQFLSCFREVEEKNEDACDERTATDVLETYGGSDIFGSVIRKKDKVIGQDVQPEINYGKKESFGTCSDWGSFTLGGLEAEHSRQSVETKRRSATTSIQVLGKEDFTDSNDFIFDVSDIDTGVYCPPEWNALNKRARTELTELLTWENLSRWDFDILKVVELSREKLHSASTIHLANGRGCPLLLVGWAILCAPMAQKAMEGSLGNNGKDEKRTSSASYSQSFPYHFVDDLNIKPEVVCNFLRIVEGLYKSENPFHNNIHGADVTQTLHCLLQFMGHEYLDLFEPVEIFSLLLAATFHDVCHPGTNNLLEKNARSMMALRYNDVSILENMHSAIGQTILMGGNDLLKKIVNNWENRFDREDRMDLNVDVHIFKHLSGAQVEKARSVMVTAVLGTDMSNHFGAMGELASLVEKVRADDSGNDSGSPRKTNRGDQKEPVLPILLRELENGKEDPSKKRCGQLANFLFKFLLHAADISNPTKTKELAIYWADKAIQEFFAQGKIEEAQGLPISPLCDWRTVKKEDSQIGFLKFVIRPTYALLGDIIPKVQTDIMPIIEENIKYWTLEKSRHSLHDAKTKIAALRVFAMNKKHSIPEETSYEKGEEASDGEEASNEKGVNDESGDSEEK